jgi:hypothetical protein
MADTKAKYVSLGIESLFCGDVATLLLLLEVVVVVVVLRERSLVGERGRSRSCDKNILGDLSADKVSYK